MVQNQILHWVKPCTDVIGGGKECEIPIIRLKGKELICNVNVSRWRAAPGVKFGPKSSTWLNLMKNLILNLTLLVVQLSILKY